LDFYDILSKFSFLNVIKQLTLKMFKSSIIVIILGSFLFLFAAFWVPTSRVFGEPEAGKRLEIIMNNKTSWNLVQGLFGAGAIVAAIGMGLMAYFLQRLNNSWLINFAAILLIIGSIFWIWHLYL
jgi:ABC-type maltose transport system permease subunit